MGDVIRLDTYKDNRLRVAELEFYRLMTLVCELQADGHLERARPLLNKAVAQRKLIMKLRKSIETG